MVTKKIGQNIPCFLIKYFKKLGITEWDSFCEVCMSEYSRESEKKWNESKI